MIKQVGILGFAFSVLVSSPMHAETGAGSGQEELTQREAWRCVALSMRLDGMRQMHRYWSEAIDTAPTPSSSDAVRYGNHMVNRYNTAGQNANHAVDDYQSVCSNIRISREVYDVACGRIRENSFCSSITWD